MRKNISGRQQKLLKHYLTKSFWITFSYNCILGGREEYIFNLARGSCLATKNNYYTADLQVIS
jgi:hypothetical protein